MINGGTSERVCIESWRFRKTSSQFLTREGITSLALISGEEMCKYWEESLFCAGSEGSCSVDSVKDIVEIAPSLALKF
jgi:hypothetical protein